MLNEYKESRRQSSCIPSKNKFKTQMNNKLRWLASDINFKLLHTGCLSLMGHLVYQFIETCIVSLMTSHDE